MLSTKLFNRAVLFTAIVSLSFLTSCKKDEEPKIDNAFDSADVLAESQVSNYFQEIDDMSLAAADDDATAGGRIAQDDRFSCATITVAPNSTETAGSFVIDFKTGCGDSKGNLRKGKLNVAYSNGPVGLTGFKAVITTEGYGFNTVSLKGTRTITKLESAAGVDKHQISLAGGKATWSDGKSVTREASFVRTLNYNDQTLAFSEGRASGTNRRDKPYTSSILKTLVVKNSCITSDGIYMPVEGTLNFISGGREMVLDYGDGSCDRDVLVAVGTYSTTVSVSE